MTVNIPVGVKNGLANCLTLATITPPPRSLDCAVLWLLPGRQLDNPRIFCHSTDASVFLCPKRINPSVTSPPPPLLFFVTVIVASNCMWCILTLQVTQA